MEWNKLSVVGFVVAAAVSSFYSSVRPSSVNFILFSMYTGYLVAGGRKVVHTHTPPPAQKNLEN